MDKRLRDALALIADTAEGTLSALTLRPPPMQG
jgi:hypothetical protein